MATLTVTITEAVTLNGASRGSTNTHTETVTQIDHRIVSCLHSAEQTVLLFDSAVAAGTIKDGTLDYLRPTLTAATSLLYGSEETTKSIL